MVFFANRANLDRRTLLTRIHSHLHTRVDKTESPVRHVRYHPSSANKTGVRATVDAPTFLGQSYPTDEVVVHVSFDFPTEREYDVYEIQWVDRDRGLMLGWHQDETHADLGGCHFQVDHQGKTVQRSAASLLDAHPLNVYEHRLNQVVEVIDALTWNDGLPSVPEQAVR
jgi:DUF1680 family protein